jgi:hypothetical protein
VTSRRRPPPQPMPPRTSTPASSRSPPVRSR